MAVIMQKADYEFWLLSIKFYSAIDKYAIALNLSAETVAAYKEDSELLMHVFNYTEQYPVYAQNFSSYIINKLRNRFLNLAEECKNSKNYTVPIGHELGIEIPVYAFLPS